MGESVKQLLKKDRSGEPVQLTDWIRTLATAVVALQEALYGTADLDTPDPASTDTGNASVEGSD
jgi:hypothetical protein